ncbi:maleylpyruvate isomerase family mycothiol-dependent enzyme [Nocardioides carbamazepini]|uniref:maleylpyruvate isomerase family mycothiol-dependent enzyme n=1 Tax=Nocardioides carbamazepini TaxID=2854259 RepID=UPI00214A4A16|nr:maleylpyruvate isomerase family mycothiol-dependent enzyme [Nocardioides carbamazepini]MCR1784762.1 maleylpyruvate isomerase family mycothiol-dependent enzyme [Nocardioides carbamazepini]
MSDRDLLAGYVENWWSSVGDLVALLDELGPDDWSAPTDLPGWDVKAVASHTAHLESILAGGPEETADIGAPSHVTGPMGQFTEIGVVTRRDRDPASIVEEIRTSTGARRAALAAAPPEDPAAAADGIFGLIGWNTRTLLRNRPLDLWMHEQDIRRAVGRPGGLDTPGARHTADYLVEAFGFVVGKRAAPPAGTTAVLAVEGSAPTAVRVGDDGRAHRLDGVPDEPTVSLAMDRESFIVLAGGRRAAAPGAVIISGDQELGERIVAGLATTP